MAILLPWMACYGSDRSFLLTRPRLDRWARMQVCGVLNQQNHGNQPKTMINHETTLKNHGNQPKTMKNHETTLKNHANQFFMFLVGFSWVEVTSPTRGPNWPFRCLDCCLLHFSQNCVFSHKLGKEWAQGCQIWQQNKLALAFDHIWYLEVI